MILPACFLAQKRLYFRSMRPTCTAIHKVYLNSPDHGIVVHERSRGEFSANDALDFTKNARGKTGKRVKDERERSWKEQASWYTQAKKTKVDGA